MREPRRRFRGSEDRITFGIGKRIGWEGVYLWFVYEFRV